MEFMAFKDGAVQEMVAVVGARTPFDMAVVPSRVFAACERGCRIEAISVWVGARFPETPIWES